MPRENAWLNTSTSGSTTNTVRKAMASAMMIQRIQPGSVRASSRAACQSEEVCVMAILNRPERGFAPSAAAG